MSIADLPFDLFGANPGGFDVFLNTLLGHVNKYNGHERSGCLLDGLTSFMFHGLFSISREEIEEMEGKCGIVIFRKEKQDI